MTLRRLIAYCWFVPYALAQTPCVTVTGDQILGGDLARAVPALAALPPHTPLAPSPLPGSARVFYLSELQAVGARFSIAIDSPREACFRLATETLNRDQVAEAMRQALRIPGARTELLETTSGPVPVGAIEFAREDLSAPAAPDLQTPVLWRGHIVYAGNRRFPIWAKVHITAPVNRLVAVEALRSGVAIRTGQVRSEVVEAFPMPASAALSVEQVIGMMPARPVAVGAEIRPDNLTRPNDVNRGDLVHVEVRVGGAHLALTGRAESGGHTGDMVAVRNPDSSKVFQALVEGAGRVIVERPGGVASASGN